MHETLAERLTELIKPLAASCGLEVWGLEIPASRGGVLRVYVDSPDGVGVDQCATLSRHISVTLDVEDPLPGPYTLEVSSPGLERPFFEAAQMPPYIGQPVALKLTAPAHGRKKWQGVLRNAEEERITLDVDGQEQVFAWEDVAKAHLVFQDAPKQGH
ncbi:MAG: ribosome maturation factor RimP [Desulfohalobium sp.]